MLATTTFRTDPVAGYFWQQNLKRKLQLKYRRSWGRGGSSSCIDQHKQQSTRENEHKNSERWLDSMQSVILRLVSIVEKEEQINIPTCSKKNFKKCFELSSIFDDIQLKDDRFKKSVWRGFVDLIPIQLLEKAFNFKTTSYPNKQSLLQSQQECNDDIIQLLNKLRIFMFITFMQPSGKYRRVFQDEIDEIGNLLQICPMPYVQSLFFSASGFELQFACYAFMLGYFSSIIDFHKNLSEFIEYIASKVFGNFEQCEGLVHLSFVAAYINRFLVYAHNQLYSCPQQMIFTQKEIEFIEILGDQQNKHYLFEHTHGTFVLSQSYLQVGNFEQAFEKSGNFASLYAYLRFGWETGVIQNVKICFFNIDSFCGQYFVDSDNEVGLKTDPGMADQACNYFSPLVQQNSSGVFSSTLRNIPVQHACNYYNIENKYALALLSGASPIIMFSWYIFRIISICVHSEAQFELGRQKAGRNIPSDGAQPKSFINSGFSRKLLQSTLVPNFGFMMYLLLQKINYIEKREVKQGGIEQIEILLSHIKQNLNTTNCNYSQLLFSAQTFSQHIAQIEAENFVSIKESFKKFLVGMEEPGDLKVFINYMKKFKDMYNEISCIRKWKNISNSEEMSLISLGRECLNHYVYLFSGIPLFYEDISVLPEIIYITSAGTFLLSHPAKIESEICYNHRKKLFVWQYELMRLRMIYSQRTFHQLTNDEFCTFFNFGFERAPEFLAIINQHIFKILPRLNPDSLFTKIAIQNVLISLSDLQDILAVLQYTPVLWQSAFSSIICRDRFERCKIQKVKYQTLVTCISLFSYENQKIESRFMAIKIFEVCPEIDDFYFHKSLTHYRDTILNQQENIQNDIKCLLSQAICNRIIHSIRNSKKGNKIYLINTKHLAQVRIVQQVFQDRNMLNNQILVHCFESLDKVDELQQMGNKQWKKAKYSMERQAVGKAILQVLEDFNQSINQRLLQVVLDILGNWYESNYEEAFISLVKTLEKKVSLDTQCINLISKHMIHKHIKSLHIYNILRSAQSKGINIQHAVLQCIQNTVRNSSFQIQTINDFLSLLEDDRVVHVRVLQMLFSRFHPKIEAQHWKTWVTDLQRGLPIAYCENNAIQKFVLRHQNYDLVDLMVKNATDHDLRNIVQKTVEFENGRRIWNILCFVPITLLSFDNFVGIFGTFQYACPKWRDFTLVTTTFFQTFSSQIQFENLEYIVKFMSTQHERGKKLFLLQFGEQISNQSIQSAQKSELFEYAVYLRDNMQDKNIVISYAALGSVIISLEKLHFQNDEIQIFTHKTLVKLCQTDRIVLQGQNQVDLMQKIFNIYLQSSVGEEQLLWLADNFIFRSPLDEQTKILVLLPKLNEMYNKFNSCRILYFIEQVLGLAVCESNNINQVLIVVKNILKHNNRWKLPKHISFFIIENQLKSGNFSRCWDIFSKQHDPFQEYSVDQLTDISLVLDCNNGKIDKSNQNGLFLLQNDILAMQIRQKNDRICSYAAYWFNNRIYQNGVQILQYFDSNKENVNDEILTWFLNSLENLHNIDNLLEKIPSQIITQLSISFSLLVQKLSPVVIEMLACKYDQFCLKGYDYLLRHYKKQISPQVWKSALLAAKTELDFEKGFSILKSVESKAGEKSWQLDSKELLECKFQFYLLGNNDIATAYIVLQQWYDLVGGPPSQEILVTLLKYFENDPYTSGEFVDEMLFEMYNQDPRWPQANAEIFVRQLSVLMQSLTVRTSIKQSVKMQLHIFVRDKFVLENCDKRCLVDFLEQCLIIDGQFLGVLFVSMIFNDVFSDDIVDAVESDAKTASFLSEMFGVSSIMDSVYAEDNLLKFLKRKEVKEIQKILLDELKSIA